MSAKNTHPLLWLTPLYVVWSILFLHLLEPSYLFLSWPDEELYRGAMAKELLEGLKMPLLSYRPDTYGGGFFVISFLIAFFFKVLGMSLFALKLAPLSFAVLSLIFWHLAISRTLGEKAAILFSLFFIFAPPTFMRYMLWGMGNHPQTIALSGIAIFLYFTLLQEEQPSKRIQLFLGLICGFSLWFSYTFGITLLTIFLFSILRARKFFKSHFFFFCIAFVLGFSPWLITNMATGFSGLNIQEDGLLGIFSHPMLIENITDPSRFIGRQFWAMCFPILENPGENWMIAALIATTLILPVLLWGWRTVMNFFGSFFFLYGVCAAFFLQLWPVHAIRIYIIALPIHLVFAAYGISSTFGSKNLKQCLMGFIPLFCIVSSFTLFNSETSGHIFTSKGYSYQAIGTAEDITPYLQTGLAKAAKQFTPEDYAELEASLLWAQKERLGLLSDDS